MQAVCDWWVYSTLEEVYSKLRNIQQVSCLDYMGRMLLLSKLSVLFEEVVSESYWSVLRKTSVLKSKGWALWDRPNSWTMKLTIIYWSPSNLHSIQNDFRPARSRKALCRPELRRKKFWGLSPEKKLEGPSPGKGRLQIQTMFLFVIWKDKC